MIQCSFKPIQAAAIPMIQTEIRITQIEILKIFFSLIDWVFLLNLFPQSGLFAKIPLKITNPDTPIRLAVMNKILYREYPRIQADFGSDGITKNQIRQSSPSAAPRARYHLIIWFIWSFGRGLATKQSSPHRRPDWHRSYILKHPKPGIREHHSSRLFQPFFPGHYGLNMP